MCQNANSISCSIRSGGEEGNSYFFHSFEYIDYIPKPPFTRIASPPPVLRSDTILTTSPSIRKEKKDLSIRTLLPSCFSLLISP